MRTTDLFRDVCRIFGRGFPLMYIASLHETAGSETTVQCAKHTLQNENVEQGGLGPQSLQRFTILTVNLHKNCT